MHRFGMLSCLMMISYVRMICRGEQFSRYTQRCSYIVQMNRWVRLSDPESRLVSQDWFRKCFVSYRSGELGVLHGNQEVHQPRILGRNPFSQTSASVVNFIETCKILAGSGQSCVHTDTDKNGFSDIQ